MSLTLNDVFIKHPECLKRMKPENNVVALLQTAEDGDKVIFGTNLITDHGVIFYAHQLAAETPPLNFYGADRRMLLQNPASSVTITPSNTARYGSFANPITDSSKITEVPALDNTDADNGGRAANTVTWKTIWAAADFGQQPTDNEIRGGCIHARGDVPTSTSELLAHWVFAAPFRKTSTDTLTVWVNHTLGRSS